MQRTELRLGLVVAIAALIWDSATAAQPAGQTPVPAVTCPANQDGLTFVCGPRDVEDLVQVPGSDWLIGGETGFSSFPGGLVAINTRNKTWHRIFPNDKTPASDSGPACKAAPAANKFTAVGLGVSTLSGGAMRLYAAQRARKAVEVFDLRMTSAGPELSWNSCIPMPPNATGNAIVTLPDGRFAISTFYEDGFGFEDMKRGVNTGRVLIWTPGRGFTELPGSFLPGPNGVALDPDGTSLFTAVHGTREIIRIALDGRGILQRVPIDFSPDNIHSAPDGSLLVGGRGLDAACAGTAAAGSGRDCPLAVVVVRVNLPAGTVQPILRMTHNPNFFGGSASVQVRDEIWVTAVPSVAVAYLRAK